MTIPYFPGVRIPVRANHGNRDLLTDSRAAPDLALDGHMTAVQDGDAADHGETQAEVAG